MADEITVVRVEQRNRPGSKQWRVHFSARVHLYIVPSYVPSTKWDAVTDDNDWLYTDELGAFQWGLKVIEKHKEREQTNATE